MSKIIPQDPASSNKRVSLKHALIVVDYYTDPLIRGLNFKYGALSELLLVRLTCCISKSPAAIIDRDTAYSVASDLGLRDQAIEIVQYMIDKGILLIQDDCISKPSVIKDSEKLAKVQEDYRERKKLQREREQAAKIKQELNSVNVTRDNSVTDTVTGIEKSELLSIEDLKTEDLNSNPKQGESKGGDPPEAPKPYANALPESLDTPEIRDALGIWLVKQVQLHKPRDQMAIEALTANWANRPKEFLHALRESTANGWKTLIEPKSTAGPPNGRISYEKETNYDRNVRNILEG